MRSLRTTTKSSPHSPQLEKAREQQRRPKAAKNKINKFIKKKLYVLCFLPTQSVHFCMTIKHGEIDGVFDHKENFLKLFER